VLFHALILRGSHPNLGRCLGYNKILRTAPSSTAFLLDAGHPFIQNPVSFPRMESKKASDFFSSQISNLRHNRYRAVKSSQRKDYIHMGKFKYLEFYSAYKYSERTRLCSSTMKYAER
jgi:hypothetical protein